jgi:membrane-bound lytic murein transglycosylase A
MKYRAALSVLFGLALAACASSPMPAPVTRPGVATRPPSATRPVLPQPATPPLVANPDFMLTAARFTDIPGWAQADFAPALNAFRRQCTGWRLRGPDALVTGGRYGGKVGLWLPACDAADRVQPGQERAFFESHFEPALVDGLGQGEAKLTAYFEPMIEARREWSPPFTEPLLRRPPDMVTVDLGAFAEAFDSGALRGAPRQLNGRLTGDRVEPYPKREAITPYQGQIIGYAHPGDVYNLQVQGSGRLRFPDGTEARAQFSAQNGYKWNSALGQLRNSGRLASATWAGFKQWLDLNPAEQKSALNADPSYVFFQEETIPDPAAGPKGAAGISLTPMGSIAVDPNYHPYGAVVFVEGTYEGAAFQRLLVAQDTGGAIRRGPQRGDIFIGSGAAAGAYAEKMNAAGPRWWTLLPKLVETPVASLDPQSRG